MANQGLKTTAADSYPPASISALPTDVSLLSFLSFLFAQLTTLGNILG